MLGLTLREPALAPAARDPDRALDRARRRHDLRHVRADRADRPRLQPRSSTPPTPRTTSSIELRTRQRQQRRLPEPFPASVLSARRARCPASPRRPARSTRSARSCVRERQAEARQLDRRRSAARVLDVAAALRPRQVRRRAPRHARTGEIALLEDTADEGATPKVGTDGRPRDARRPQAAARRRHLQASAPTASLGGALVSSIPLADAQRWYGFEGQFTQVNLQAEPGVSHAELRDRVRAALGSRYKVQTGSEKAKADSKGISDLINGFLGPACSRSAASPCSSAPS